MPNTYPSNSPWPRRARRSSAALVLIGVFVVTLFIANAPAQAARPKPTPTPTPTNCILAPALRDVTVNQGVGTYSPLVRGKETLVRAYLSKPACASSSDVIELTGASLAVTAAGVTTDDRPAHARGPDESITSARGVLRGSPRRLDG